MDGLLSWGRYPRHLQRPHPVGWPADIAPAVVSATREGCGTLAYGMGRSYGDSCLAEGDEVVFTRAMDRVLSADWSTGVVRAQAGLTLDALIRMALPRGWFLPVTPGTKFVTLGGALANDVHGKNHHVRGTFGRHVKRFGMFRSDRGFQEHVPGDGMFEATVGGLGLTGVVLEVELQLRPVASSLIEQRNIRFGHLDEFFAISAEHDAAHEYAVAWIDCLAHGASTGRGHYTLGNHAEAGPLQPAEAGPRSMPIDPPFSLVNRASLQAFNSLYFHRQQVRERRALVGYDPFFYPLDQLLHWNRMYGRAGFQQYQCVVPRADAPAVVGAVLRAIARSGSGSFLAVLKQCGGAVSPGLLSFPMPGVSLALDFAQHAEANRRLFAHLDAMVHEAGGRLYPAKDAHMGAAHFQQAYPAWVEVERLRDPLLMSRFWKRVTSL